MSFRNTITYNNVEEAIVALSKLKPEDVTVAISKDGAAGSKYYSITFKIDGKPSSISVKFAKENLKITPQTETENGPSKVKCTFFKEESKLGQLFELLDNLIIPAIRTKLPEKIYPGLNSLIQTHTLVKSKDGGDSLVQISKPLGWITLPCSCKPVVNKLVYGGSITIAGVQKEPIRLQKPKFAEINKFWSQRAIVNAYVVLDNILLMKTKQIYFTASINIFMPLTVLPIRQKEIDNTEDIRELEEFANTNNLAVGIDEKEEIEEAPKEISKIYNESDFEEEPN